MLDISRRLLYYKRKDVQEAIVRHSRDREVGIRFGGGGYGKRPDILEYPADVMAVIKKGATSFHISEERWHNPMQLVPGMRKQEMDELRKGWDLVLDIDCPYWFYSKLSAYLFVQALSKHGITSISAKFSGNKGFHIGVPFETFPSSVNNQAIDDLFPEGPKRIALYLLHYISTHLITVEKGRIQFSDIHTTTRQKIAEETGLDADELSTLRCPDCSRERGALKAQTEFICSRCQRTITRDDDTKVLVCPKCSILMEKIDHAAACVCGSKQEPKEVFDPLSIVDLDTLLISSRHMYRAPFSMHEKSGLVSVIIDPESIMTFEKAQAEPDKVDASREFLFWNGEKNEARNLLIQAFDYKVQQPQQETEQRTYELPDQAVPEEYFPPSIKKGLEGLEDGKKRFLFILINFLKTLGWTHAKIEERVLEWNKQNPEPLRENYVTGQLRYTKNKKPVPPPNYATGIYKDLRIEDDQQMMDRYKNPVTYAKALYGRSKKKSRRLTKKQKEMRRKYRQKKANENKKKG